MRSTVLFTITSISN